MTTLTLRAIAFGLMLGVAPIGAAVAQEAAAEASQTAVEEMPWRLTVTGQIEAFRSRDPSGAFAYAADAFHQGFPSPEAFFVAIVGSGYAPIMESRSHSFGEFRRIDDVTVMQRVKFVGEDQMLYEALYLLGEEEGEWRVQGVQLMKQQGLGV